MDLTRWLSARCRCSSFAPVVGAMPGLIPDGFIYRRAEPSTWHTAGMASRRLHGSAKDM